jgi:hypothetical protein
MGKKCTIQGMLNTKSCGWKIISIKGDGNCFFSCIHEAIRNTTEYHSDNLIGLDHVPSVWEMREWWSASINEDTVCKYLEQIRSYENGMVPGMDPIVDVYRRWLHTLQPDHDKEEEPSASSKRQKTETGQSRKNTKGKKIAEEEPNDNEVVIHYESPLPTKDQLPMIRNEVQSLIRRDQGDNIIWADQVAISLIAKMLRLRILIVWTRKTATSPFYLGGTCDDFIGTVILTNNESHFNLVSWSPPRQIDKKDKRSVTIFPDEYYPDLLRRMFCCLQPGDPHNEPLA